MRGHIQSQVRKTIGIQVVVAALYQLSWLAILVSATIIGWHFVLKYW